jgi:hypothetical protein
VWRGCQLRIFAVSERNDDNAKMKKQLQKYIYMLRIDASVYVDQIPSGHDIYLCLALDRRYRWSRSVEKRC